MENINVFVSYSHTDSAFKDDFLKYAAPISISMDDVTIWHDGNIRTGENIKSVIDDNLNKMSIMVCLISSDYLASNFCINQELTVALEKGLLDKNNIFPVIVRRCGWMHTVFGGIKCLPEDGKPINNWDDKDDVYTLVIDELVATIKSIRKNSDDLKKK